MKLIDIAYEKYNNEGFVKELIWKNFCPIHLSIDDKSIDNEENCPRDVNGSIDCHTCWNSEK